jgi:hypothetical protein
VSLDAPLYYGKDSKRAAWHARGEESEVMRQCKLGAGGGRLTFNEIWCAPETKPLFWLGRCPGYPSSAGLKIVLKRRQQSTGPKVLILSGSARQSI